jgi:hypothetical protein
MEKAEEKLGIMKATVDGKESRDFQVLGSVSFSRLVCQLDNLKGRV